MLFDVEQGRSIALAHLASNMIANLIDPTKFECPIYGAKFDPSRHWAFDVYDPQEPRVGHSMIVIVDRLSHKVIASGTSGE